MFCCGCALLLDVAVITACMAAFASRSDLREFRLRFVTTNERLGESTVGRSVGRQRMAS